MVQIEIFSVAWKNKNEKKIYEVARQIHMYDAILGKNVKTPDLKANLRLLSATWFVAEKKKK